MKRILLVVGFALLALAGAVGYRIWDEVSRSISEDPRVWEGAIRYRPRTVVIFVGTNDLGAGLGEVPKTPERVLVLTHELLARIRAGQPEVPVYWLAVKPSSIDATRWERGQVLNRLVADLGRPH